MRFRETILKLKPDDYDCICCDRERNNCFLDHKTRSLYGPGSANDLIDVTFAEAPDRIAAEFDGDFIRGCYFYCVCPLPFFIPSAKALLETYMRLEGTARVATPDQLYKLPMKYIDACRVIDRTYGQLEREIKDH